jgi:glucose/arabinose dehydrogenase
MSRQDGGRRFALSLAAGLLLIPLSATAGFAVINGIATQPDEAETNLPVETSASAATTPTAQVVVEPVVATPYDMALACGPDGATLVVAETDGTISEVQQAALDALRQICAEAGLPLPDPAAPPPVVQTVEAGASSATTTRQRATHEDDDDDHEHEHEYEHEDDD